MNVTKPSVSQRQGLKKYYYVYGSSRNIDQTPTVNNDNNFVTSIVTKRLELEGNPQEKSEGSGEEVVIFDDIYPRSDYQITGVTSIEIQSEEIDYYEQDGTPHYKTYNVYNLQIKDFSDYVFSLIQSDEHVQNIEDIVASGKPLSLKFITKDVQGVTSTPRLAGFEFELGATLCTDSQTGEQWYEFQIQHQDLNGYIIPNDSLIPQVGDWVCIYNVKGAYIGGLNSNNGQADLRNAFNKWYANKKKDVSYTVRPYADESIDLNLGDAVELQYGGNVIISRVYSFEKHLDYNIDASYTISSYAKMGSVNQLKEDVKVLTASIANGTAGGSMDASAVSNAIQTYGKRLFLSKVNDDAADGHITFKEGITSQKNSSLQTTTFGTFNSRFLGSGACIDSEGNAEFKSIYSREFISTPEFRFNRITVTEGEQWNTNGFGVIEEVDTANRIIYLKVEDGDWPSVSQHDFCRGLFNNIGCAEQEGDYSGNGKYNLDNQPIYDDCNFPTKVGFFTSYFYVASEPIKGSDGRWSFSYYKRTNDTPDPCKNMKFAQYGNRWDTARQASLYQTSVRHAYIQQLEGVNDWVIQSANIVSRYGYLGDLTVTLKNPDGSTYNETLNGNGLYVQKNVYFGGATVQLDPQTIEDLKNQLANYEVYLTAYTDVIKVDDAGNVIDGLWQNTGEAPNISTQYRIQSSVSVRNGNEILTIEEGNVPTGKGKYKLMVHPYGCSCIVQNSTIYITGIDNVKDGVAGTNDDLWTDEQWEACRAMERVWVEIEVDCEGNGVITKTLPITIKHDPVPYIMADLTNENASVSWSSDEERYIGLPIETYVNMAKGNEDLKIDGLVVNTINGLVPNWSSFQWDGAENAYVYEEEVDYFHPSPTAGWRILIAPQYMAETSHAPAVGDEDNPLAALIRVVKMPINAPSITEILITCTTEYAGVHYERTLSLHIARFADVAIWDIIPTHRSISVDRNAFFNYPYVGVNIFCTDKSGRRAVTTLPSGFRLQYKISEVISSFTPVLNPTGNPAEQGWFELVESEPVIPYDAEIEYLQSTGVQYINTGISPSTNFECEVKAEFTQNQAGFDTLLGSYTSTSEYGVALAIRATLEANAGYIQFGDNAGGTSLIVSSIQTLGLHTYKTSLKNSSLKVDVDGTVNSRTWGTGQSPSSLPMYMFARNKGSGTIGNYSKAKVYYCKIWNGGTLVRDFIPVRVGQVGYMYDKVSGQLFGNSGTGSFTLGNDITPIEYLQATGTQYIDTGINAQSVTRFVVDGCCYPDSGNNTQLLGGTAQGAGTFFGARVNNGTFWYCMANGNGLGDPTHRSTIDATIVSTSSQTGTLADLVSGTTSNFTSFSSGSWQFPNENLLLFGGYSTRRSPNARCYSLQIYTSSGLVRDFIPVSVGGVGYLYDKISNKLFGNAGTGNFTLGSEVTQEVSQNQGSQSQDYVVTTDTSVVSGKTYYVHSYASVDSEPVTLSDPTTEVRVNDPSYADTIKSIIFTLLNESVEVADEEEVLVVREGIGGQGSTGPAGNGVQQVTDYYMRAKEGYVPVYPNTLDQTPSSLQVEVTQANPSGWVPNVFTAPEKTWPCVWHFTKYDYTSSPDYDTRPNLLTTYSEDGRSIKSVHTYYLRTTETNVHNIKRLDEVGGENLGWVMDVFSAPEESLPVVWRYFVFEFEPYTSNEDRYSYSPIEFVAKFVQDGLSTQTAYKIFPASVTPSLDNVSTGASAPATDGSSWSFSLNGLVVTAGTVLWMTQRTYRGTTYNDWSTPIRISGDKGENGADGTDIEFIYKLSNDGNPTSAEKPTDFVNDAPWSGKDINGDDYSYDDDDFNPSKIQNAAGQNLGWTDNPSGVGYHDEEGVSTFFKYEWVCQRVKPKGSEHWGGWTDPFVWSAYGDTGMDGDGVEYVFKLQDSTPATPNRAKFFYSEEGGIYTNGYPRRDWNGSVYKEGGNWYPKDFEKLYPDYTFRGWAGGGYDDGEWIPAGNSISSWTDNPTGVSDAVNCKKEWVSVRKRVNGEWGGFSTPALWSTFSKTPQLTIVDGYWYLDGQPLLDNNRQHVRAEGIDGTGVRIKGHVDYWANDDIPQGVVGATTLEGVQSPTEGDCWLVEDSRFLYVYIGGNHTNWYDDWEALGEFKGVKGDSVFMHIAWATGRVNNSGVLGHPIVVINGVEQNNYFDVVQQSGVEYEWMGVCTTDSTHNPTGADPSDNADWELYKWNHIKGKDGANYERVYMRTQIEVAPVIDTAITTDGNGTQNTADEFLPAVENVSDCGAYSSQFTDDPLGVGYENVQGQRVLFKYEWMAERKKVDKTWQAFSPARLWAVYAKDGEGVTNVTARYLKTTMSSGVTRNTEGNWTNNFIPPDENEPYVWRYTITIIGDGVEVPSSDCELFAVYSPVPNVNLLDDTAFASDFALGAWKQTGHVSGDSAADPKNVNHDSSLNNFFGVAGGTQGKNSYYGRFKSSASASSSSYVILLEQEIRNSQITKVELGKWYTLSFWAKVGNASSKFTVEIKGQKYVGSSVNNIDIVDTGTGMYINGQLVKNKSSQQFLYGESDASNQWQRVNTEWRKIVITFKTVSTLDDDRCFINWKMDKNNVGHEVYICMPKLEVGMIATTYQDSQASKMAYPRTGEWEAGKQYYSGVFGEPFIDAVTKGRYWYRCKKSHISTSENAPSGSSSDNEHWSLASSKDFISAGLILADVAYIKNLGVELLRTGQGNVPHVEMHDEKAEFYGSLGFPSIELAVDDDNVGVLRFYDASGNAMYDLGPKGITNQAESANTRYDNFLVYKIGAQTTIGNLLRIVGGEVLPLAESSFAVKYELHEGFRRLSGVVTYNISGNSRPSTWNLRLYKNNSYTDSMFRESDIDGFNNFMENGWYIDPNCGPAIDLGSDWATMEFHKYQNGKFTSLKVLKFSMSEVVSNQSQAYSYDEQGTRNQLVIQLLD